MIIRAIIAFVVLLVALKMAELASGQRMASVAAGLALFAFIIYAVVLLGWGYQGIRDQRWGTTRQWIEERMKLLRSIKRRKH